MAEQKRWRRAIICIGISVGCTAISFSDLCAADIKRGKVLYEKQCAVCHTLIPEYHREGPSLAGIFGKKAGTVPFFTGYKALKGSTIIWNETTLDAWLTDPRAMVSGKDTGMTVRVENAIDRADIIGFMKTAK